MKRMSEAELNTVRGTITIDQARSVANSRSCPRCAGGLVFDDDEWAEDSLFGTGAMGRLMCLNCAYEIAEVRRNA